jgi:hypothetical protein
MVKMHQDVLPRLVRKARKVGASSVSQYAADVLALHVGLPECVVELNQTAIVPSSSRIKKLRGDSRDRVMIRPHRAVAERLAHLALASGLPPQHVSPYIAGVLAAHVGLPQHARTPSKEEVLPLAI